MPRNREITLVNAAYNEPYKVRSLLQPLGILYLAAYLRRYDWDIDYRDYQLVASPSPRPQELANLLVDACDIVGIGCHSAHLPLICEAVTLLKKARPDKFVILGGVGPTLVARELMGAFEAVDLVVRGEGEVTLLEALTAISQGDDLSQVKGLCYRRGQHVAVTPNRELIPNLDVLPRPAYDLLDFSVFQDPGLPVPMRRLASVAPSRGCPYRCPFCSNSALYGGRVRLREPQLVAEEVGFLCQQFGCNFINFTDDTFTLDRDRTIQLCKALRQEAPGVKWKCGTRVDLVDTELMTLMAEAGCIEVQYGLESGSEHMRKKLGKQIGTDRAIEIIEESVKIFPKVKVSFMWGFPFESLDDLYETVTIMRLLSEKGAYLNFVFWEPYPGTALFERYRSQLRLLEELEPADRPRDYQYDASLLATIMSHPAIFTNLAFVPSDTLAEKVRLLRAWGFPYFDLGSFRIPVTFEQESTQVPDSIPPDWLIGMNEMVRLQHIGRRSFVFNTRSSALYEINREAAELLHACAAPAPAKELVERIMSSQHFKTRQVEGHVMKALAEFLRKGWLSIKGEESAK